MPAWATMSIGLSVVAHGEQLGRRREVVVPQIVVDRLEVPRPLAGARIERKQAVAEQVVARAIGAIQIVSGRAGREEYDSVLAIDGDLAPLVGAAGVSATRPAARCRSRIRRGAGSCETSTPVCR